MKPRLYRMPVVQSGGAPPATVAIDIQFDKPGYLRLASIWKDNDSDVEDAIGILYLMTQAYGTTTYFWRIGGFELIDGQDIGGPNRASWEGKIPVDSTMHLVALIIPTNNDETFVLEALVDEESK